MADRRVQLTVLTPNRTVLENNVDSIILRTTEGDMGILPGHEPCSVLLDFGVLRSFVDREQADVLAVMGGFATVKDNKVTVLSAMAELPDQLEEAIAKRKQERAANKRREQDANLEMRRAESALRRTLVQLDISSYAIIKGRGEGDDDAGEEGAET